MPTRRHERCPDGIGCSLWKTCKYVRLDGEGKTDKPYVMLIGEAPGYHEEVEKRPFIGKSGQLIRTLIKQMDLEDDCYITNAVRCRPPDNRNPTAKELRVCNKYLVAEIERVKPKHLVALGTFAIRALTGEDQVSVAGKRGIRSWEFLGIPVIATYHPAAVLRNSKLKRPLYTDLNRLIDREYVKPEKVIWTRHNKVSSTLLYDTMAFDLETSQLSPYKSGGRILCVSWSGRDHVSHVSQDIAGFVTALAQRTPRLVGHNVKFDLSWLKEKHGYVHAGELEDTMVLAHLVDENRLLNLKSLAAQFTGYGDYARGINRTRISEISEDQLFEYCAYDSAATWILYQYLGQQCEDQGLIRLYAQEIRLIRTLLDVQSRGFQLDLSRSGAMEVEMTAEMNRISSLVQDRLHLTFNVGSTKQLGEALFKHAGYISKMQTKTGRPSVKQEALELIEDDIPASLTKEQARGLITDVLKHRKMSKLLGTYLKGVQTSLDGHDRVHPTYNPTGTKTGRLSSSEPNMQNIPREKTAPIKQVYVAPHGRALVMADYSQIELRICAWLTRDAAMLDCFEKNLDLHAETARAILGHEPSEEERFHAKTVNFMVLFGGGAKRLARLTGNSETWAERYLRKWQATYPGVLDWKQGIRQQLLDRGWVTNAFGRRRRLPLAFAGGTRMYEKMLRQACNHPIQGTAGELCNMAMVMVDDKLNEILPDAWVYGAVHDQVLAECNWKDRKRVGSVLRTVMEDSNAVVQDFGFRLDLDVPTPVDVTIGRCWAEMEEM